MLMKNIMYTY